jgi:Flp pilus assembly protein TadB
MRQFYSDQRRIMSDIEKNEKLRAEHRQDVVNRELKETRTRRNEENRRRRQNEKQDEERQPLIEEAPEFETPAERAQAALILQQERATSVLGTFQENTFLYMVVGVSTFVILAIIVVVLLLVKI